MKTILILLILCLPVAAGVVYLAGWASVLWKRRRELRYCAPVIDEEIYLLLLPVSIVLSLLIVYTVDPGPIKVSRIANIKTLDDAVKKANPDDTINIFNSIVYDYLPEYSVNSEGLVYTAVSLPMEFTIISSGVNNYEKTKTETAISSWANFTSITDGGSFGYSRR